MADNNQDYNRGGFLAFIFSIVFVCLFFFYLMFIHPGVDLGEKIRDPNKTSEPVATTPEKQFDITSVKEVWAENPDVVKYGAEIFKVNCAMCHGDHGMGDGAAAAAMNPKPRNLVEGKWKNPGDSIGLFNTITKGLTGTSMAAFGHIKADDRWALVQFIRSITKNKINDDAIKLKEFATTVNK
jgi:mono/diheme cytochrome c family protein